MILSINAGTDAAMSNRNDLVIENGVWKEYRGDGGDVVIPAGVTIIGDDDFYECESLTIRAPAGSCAEEYACREDISFSAV